MLSAGYGGKKISRELYPLERYLVIQRRVKRRMRKRGERARSFHGRRKERRLFGEVASRADTLGYLAGSANFRLLYFRLTTHLTSGCSKSEAERLSQCRRRCNYSSVPRPTRATSNFQ